MNPNMKQNIVNGLTTIDRNFSENTSANEACENFTNILEMVMYKHSHLKTINYKAHSLRHEPWMTRGLIKSSHILQKFGMYTFYGFQNK